MSFPFIYTMKNANFHLSGSAADLSTSIYHPAGDQFTLKASYHLALNRGGGETQQLTLEDGDHVEIIFEDGTT